MSVFIAAVLTIAKTQKLPNYMLIDGQRKYGVCVCVRERECVRVCECVCVLSCSVVSISLQPHGL